jgi:hypothetical protein
LLDVTNVHAASSSSFFFLSPSSSSAPASAMTACVDCVGRWDVDCGHASKKRVRPRPVSHANLATLTPHTHTHKHTSTGRSRRGRCLASGGRIEEGGCCCFALVC